jgi:adenylate cyclase
MRPCELLVLLNRYFTKVTTIIEAHNGVVDKYIGDEIMAVFGAPIESQDHAQQATTAAIEILEALKAFNQEIIDELGFELRIGIGINTGIAVAGNIGSQSRMNYTVIGDSVNTASRLEGLTKEFGVPLIVSASTAKATPLIPWRDLGTVGVKGKAEKLQVFTVK